MIGAFLFGALGLGFFTYGRKQRAIVPLCTGVALFIFPYFMPNITLLLIVGTILVATPYFWRI